MRLLFDHNLSHKLVRRLADIYPDSTQTRLVDLATASDAVIWDHARQHGFVLVSLDADFADLSLLRGHPPKIIWLRCGNSTVDEVERLLRLHQRQIESFAQEPETSCLEIWG
jgi:predicted nuclease of predicted toxin-antitoxin system